MSASNFNLAAENDPCTPSYQRTPRTTSKKTSVKLALLRSLKRVLRIKTKKDSPTFVMLAKKSSSFVTPVEYKRMSQSSARSSRPVISTKMAGKTKLEPVLPVETEVPVRTGSPSPSPAIRRSSLYVHMYSGANSPPPEEKVSVRFSHPAVSKFMLVHSTPEPLSPSALEIEEERPSSQDSNMSDDLPAAFPEIEELEVDGTKLLTPRGLWRETNQSVTSEGKRETWTAFKGRLDGHTRRADRVDVQAPTVDVDETAKTGSVEEQRSNTLSALEGSTPSALNDRYVLAIMPRKDMPITAIQVDSDEVPSSLIPDAGSKTRTAMTRPHTFQAYSPSSHEPPKEARKLVVANPDLLAVPKFDAEQHVDPHSRHSKHYRSVESGFFANANGPSTPMHAPAPHSPIKPLHHAMSTPTFLLPPSPPSPAANPVPIAVPATPNGANRIPRKPVATARPRPPTPPKNFSKPLPPLPVHRYKAFQPSKPVEPFKMNDNGYKILAPRTVSQRFSEEPKYTRRTIDDVEAKFQRERAGKGKGGKVVEKVKSDDEAIRAIAGEEKRMVTLRDVQGKKWKEGKEAKKRSGLDALEEGLKVLMLS